VTGEIKTLEERIVYQNKYATVWDDKVLFPSGREGTYIRWKWSVPHGVGIVPIIGDDVLLLKAYRYQSQSFAVEIPQGFGEEGSTPEADAHRELEEETGLVADALRPLMQFDDGTPTFLFTAVIDVHQTPQGSGREETESITDFVRCPIGRITPGYLRSIGVRGPMTMAALLAVRLAA